MAAIQEPYTCTIEEFSSSNDGLYPERISGDGTIAVTRENFTSNDQFAGAGTDYEVRAYQWDIDSHSWTQHGEPIKDQVSDDPLWSIDLSADGSLLAVYADGPSYEEHIRIFRFEGDDWKQIGNTLYGPYLPKESLSGDGHSFVTGSLDGEIYEEVDSSDWQPKGQFVPRFGWSNYALSFNGSILASGAQVYQFVNDWIPMGEPAISLKNPNTNKVMQAVALSPNGKRLAVAMNRNNSVGPIHVFEFDGASWVPLGQVLEPIQKHDNRFYDMTFSGTILTYHSEAWTPGNHYMQVFYLQDNEWVEIEDDRWDGSYVSHAAVANETLVSFLGTTEEGVSTVYRVACRHTSAAIPSPTSEAIPRRQNSWLRFANIVVPLAILSILFQRMRKQNPKRHSEVELAEMEVTRLN